VQLGRPRRTLKRPDLGRPPKQLLPMRQSRRLAKPVCLVHVGFLVLARPSGPISGLGSEKAMARSPLPH